MRQGFFLFIRIQIFDIHAAAIRTKKLSLAAGVITGCIQLGSQPAPAAFLTFFLVLAHTHPPWKAPYTGNRFKTPFSRSIFCVKSTYFYYNQYHALRQIQQPSQKRLRLNSIFYPLKYFKKLSLYTIKIKFINKKIKIFNFFLDKTLIFLIMS